MRGSTIPRLQVRPHVSSTGKAVPSATRSRGRALLTACSVDVGRRRAVRRRQGEGPAPCALLRHVPPPLTRRKNEKKTTPQDPRSIKSNAFLVEALAFAAVFSVVRVAMNRTVFAWLARCCLHSPSQKHLNKWTESCWRFFCYTLSIVVGLTIALQTEWATDVDRTWEEGARYGFPEAQRFYFIACLGFYVHLLVMQFTEERKKDFWAMIVHHVTTLLLIYMSYFYYFVPMGTLIVLLHDVSDPVMELAKLCKYARLQRAADALFVVFAIVFGYSRLWYFPMVIIDSTYRMSPPLYPYAYEGIALLCVLLVLHSYWFSIILRMAVKFAISGTAGPDGRSDSSDSDDDTAAKKRN